MGIDPVFLQYLLGLVGNVSLPDGTVVDGTNAAKVLMHDVYWNYPVEESDGIFASVASAASTRSLAVSAMSMLRSLSAPLSAVPKRAA